MNRLENKNYIIDNYNEKKPFASFLPGIAGENGIPMWTYYCNRGQCIAGFGIENKDQSIMDFVPANVAYRRTEIAGFRTFIKFEDGNVHECFVSGNDAKQEMIIKQNGLSLKEENISLGYTLTVDYLNVTSRDYPGLIRKVTLESKNEVEILDGLATIYPRGMNNFAIKDMTNLGVAWIDVVDVDGILLYKNRSTTADSSEVSEVTEANFYASFDNEGNRNQTVYDLDIIFGTNTSLRSPEGFKKADFVDMIKKQVHVNKLPAAFTYKKGKDIVINSIFGAVDNQDVIIKNSKEFSGDFIAEMTTLSEQLVEKITSPIECKTNYPVFDAYMSQSFLDNVLRGGFPVIFDGAEGDIVYHIYSRVHGDMEREYNYFSVEPNFYSQGNGNFRDVNQNRRNDVYFVKEAGSYNIKTFMDMIQLDGYNPLGVKGSLLEFNHKRVNELHDIVKNDKIDELLSGRFTIGQLARLLHFELDMFNDDVLRKIVSLCTQDTNSEYGHGFWIDHWTYNMDLVDNYLQVYPDKVEELLYTKNYRFFESPEIVKPRKEKYVVTDKGVRQYNALKLDEDRNKRLGIKHNETNWTKLNGEIYETSLYVKLFVLALNKYANLDPFGMGVMMESDKPGWNDAMNGLPGIFGSGLSETIELRRVLKFLIESPKEEVMIPNEVISFARDLEKLSEFDEIQTRKEVYRDQIYNGLSGVELTVNSSELDSLLKLMLKTVNNGIAKATEIGDGLIPTFLSYVADDYSVDSLTNEIIVNKWKLKVLPKYLEAPARLLKQMSTNEGTELHKNVRESAMYDEKLGMYITSEPLDNESMEIGRARAFTPGWLERESCFMHMEYKYLLGLLKSGLYDEFYEDIKTALPPFMNADVYGRSPLENSSFIATSRNPNIDNHGRGFVARLTGTSTETISLWLYMMVGGKVFTYDDKLKFNIKPILHSSFFKDGLVEFNLFGARIKLLNDTGKNTYGENKAVIKSYVVDGTSVTKIEGELAMKLREGEITEITVIYE